MKIGVVFPQTELGGDVGAVRAYGEAVAGLGFHHILAYDHVVGADPVVHTGWAGPYDVNTNFHEPLVMFGYLAAITDLELVTGVIILPQRQTVLAAKQAVEVDLLTGGKFRFGVGVGWNKVEYDALGKAFTDRGRRLDVQIALLRRLWTERTLTSDSDGENVHGAGLCPMPIQQPIPVWVGGSSTPAYERVGRIADGWFPMTRPGPKLDDALATIDAAARAAGRDPKAIGMEGRAAWNMNDQDKSAAQVASWREAGATHVTIDTMHMKYADVDAHIAALTAAADAVLKPL
jgi:probable F420-dependent oxidoreductase